MDCGTRTNLAYIGWYKNYTYTICLYKCMSDIFLVMYVMCFVPDNIMMICISVIFDMCMLLMLNPHSAIKYSVWLEWYFFRFSLEEFRVFLYIGILRIKKKKMYLYFTLCWREVNGIPYNKAVAIKYLTHMFFVI